MKVIITERQEKKIIKFYLSESASSGIGDLITSIGKNYGELLHYDQALRLLSKTPSILKSLDDAIKVSKDKEELAAKLIAFFRQNMNENQAVTATQNLLNAAAEGSGLRNAEDYYNSLKGIVKTKRYKYWNEILPQERERLLSKLVGLSEKGWRYFGGKPWPGSGWKFHIYGEDLYDSVDLYNRLKPVADKWGAHAKVGAENLEDFIKPSSNQWGKQGATVWIPPHIIKNGQQFEMFSDIENALNGYTKKGDIKGDRMMTNNIGYRYEYNSPINSSIGVKNYDETGGYRPNEGGSYIIKGVEDVFGSPFKQGGFKSVWKP